MPGTPRRICRRLSYRRCVVDAVVSDLEFAYDIKLRMRLGDPPAYDRAMIYDWPECLDGGHLSQLLDTKGHGKVLHQAGINSVECTNATWVQTNLVDDNEKH
jgi:hypothetical protein